MQRKNVGAGEEEFHHVPSVRDEQVNVSPTMSCPNVSPFGQLGRLDGAKTTVFGFGSEVTALRVTDE